jgi:hypothetical protein
VRDVVHRADVRMGQLRDRARLVLEALLEVPIARQAAGEDLDGNQAIEPRVAARYTSPIPPAPSVARISYGPSFVPAARLMVRRTTLTREMPRARWPPESEALRQRPRTSSLTISRAALPSSGSLSATGAPADRRPC